MMNLNADRWEFTNHQLWLATGLAALVSILYSLFSDGFYQHDEAAHFINMQRFWHTPEVIMGNWAKPGYKILIAPFSLFGTFGLVIVNSCIAASVAFFSYKIAKDLKLKFPIIVFLLLVTQPFWVQLSFRNYSEIITTFILVIAVRSHLRSKYILAALFLSYIITIRQEFYPIIALYGLYLLWQKQGWAILALALFPILHNSIGWGLTGDPFYILNSVLGFSGDIQSAYPRQGGAHYFLMSVPVFGSVTITFFLVYIMQSVTQSVKIHWGILIPILTFLGLHVLFSLESFKIGPSTGGNLRYMIVIAPLMAILAGVAVERIIELDSVKQRLPYLFVLIPFVLIVFFFMTYEHNQLKYIYKRDFIPFFSVLICIEIILFAHSKKYYLIGITTIALFTAVLSVSPHKKTQEDQLVFETAQWLEEEGLLDQALLMNHALLFYYLGKIPEDFEPTVQPIDAESVEKAEQGSLIVWDSHYSYRPQRNEQAISHHYFLERPETYKLINGPLSTENQLFSVYIFEKGH